MQVMDITKGPCLGGSSWGRACRGKRETLKGKTATRGSPDRIPIITGLISFDINNIARVLTQMRRNHLLVGLLVHAVSLPTNL